jgi:Ca2+/H+ antiporter
MNGNIALSMEIGSAYALQVLLLQIPALVFYSAIHNLYIDESQIAAQSFSKQASSLCLPNPLLTTFSAHLPTMGYGDCHPLCLPPLVHVR